MGFITGYKITNNLDTVFSFCPEERVYGTWQSYCNWENRDRPSNFFQTQMEAVAQCSGIDMMDGSKPYETHGNTLEYPKSIKKWSFSTWPCLRRQEYSLACEGGAWPSDSHFADDFHGFYPDLPFGIGWFGWNWEFSIELWGFSIAVPEFQKGILYLLKFMKMVDISQAESFAAAGLEQLLRLALQLQRPEVPSGSGRSYFWESMNISSKMMSIGIGAKNICVYIHWPD